MKQKRPNIILIVMDTVRADHLSCYGYHRKTTPNIDMFAKRGVLFKKAFSAATWTIPSHASIFTGKYPFQHGAFGRNARLKEERTLPNILRHYGYTTIGITDCLILSSLTGFNKGFDIFINTSEIPLISPLFIREKIKDIIRSIFQGLDSHTYRINEIIKGLLRRKTVKKPFFLFINYFNAHVPYNPPKPFRNKFVISDSTIDKKKIKYIATGRVKPDLLRNKVSVSKKEWDIVKSLYDGEIAYLDHRIGELVKFLEDEGLLHDTFLIITSDHGEYFGEHKLAGHVTSLYNEVLHVPLIMVYPRENFNGLQVSHLVSTIDIFSTIMNLLGIKLGENLPSVSLYPFENRKFHNFILAESDYLEREEERLPHIHKRSICIITESYKYVYSPDCEELYDLQNDPKESINLAQKNSEKIRYFRKILEKTIRKPLDGKSLTSTEKEIIKKLRRLGI